MWNIQLCHNHHTALVGHSNLRKAGSGPPAAVVSSCAIQQHQRNLSIIDRVAHHDSFPQLGCRTFMLASTLLLFDWQALLAAVVVVIAFLWIHFAFTS